MIRGDVHHIRIGARTNIQDGCVLHVMRDEHPLVLGDDVTIGHSVTSTAAPLSRAASSAWVPSF